MRMTLEVLQAIKLAVPEGYPVGYVYLQQIGWRAMSSGILSLRLVYQKL
jgi:2,4-dienoyl-CoA reductase-like NADH-dependent reductase (Old Yellow Enzyme family)